MRKTIKAVCECGNVVIVDPNDEKVSVLIAEISRKLGDSVGAPNHKDGTTVWFLSKLNELIDIVRKESRG